MVLLIVESILSKNSSTNGFEHEGRYANNGNNGNNGHKVLLKNVKSSISIKAMQNQLERTYGPIYGINPDQKKQFAYVYFKEKQHSLNAIKDGRIKIDNTTIHIVR